MSQRNLDIHIDDDPADIFNDQQKKYDSCCSDEDREAHDKAHREGLEIIKKMKNLQKQKTKEPQGIVNLGVAPPVAGATGVPEAGLNNAIQMIMNRLDTFQQKQDEQYSTMAAKINRIEKKISSSEVGRHNSVTNTDSMAQQKPKKGKRGSLFIPENMLPLIVESKTDSEDIKQIDDFYNNLKQ